MTINLTRIAYLILGKSHWKRSFEEYESLPEVNHSFVRAIEPYVITATLVMLPLGVILDIAVWRYRHLAKWIFYFEIVS